MKTAPELVLESVETPQQSTIIRRREDQGVTSPSPNSELTREESWLSSHCSKRRVLPGAHPGGKRRLHPDETQKEVGKEDVSTLKRKEILS